MQTSGIGRRWKARKTKWNGQIFRENAEMTFLALPGIVLFAVFAYWPMFGVVIAFQDFNPALGFLGSEWVGFNNFVFFFASQDLLRTLRNTVMYNLGFLGLDLVAGVVLALALYCLRSKYAVRAYNTIMILPNFMSSVLIAFIVYALFSNSYGLTNQILGALSIKGIPWYTRAQYWPAILTVVHLWSTVGMKCIIYYASLMSIDDSLFEAAQLDGAGRMKQLRHVAIPHLVPVMVITTLLGLGGILGGDFGLFYQVPKDQGLLYKTTDIISTYTYRALLDGDLEKSSAVGLFQSAVGLVMVVATNLVVRKISPDNSLF